MRAQRRGPASMMIDLCGYQAIPGDSGQSFQIGFFLKLDSVCLSCFFTSWHKSFCFSHFLLPFISYFLSPAPTCLPRLQPVTSIRSGLQMKWKRLGNKETSLLWNNDVICGLSPCLPCLPDRKNVLEGFHPVRSEGRNWGQ